MNAKLEKERALAHIARQRAIDSDGGEWIAGEVVDTAAEAHENRPTVESVGAALTRVLNDEHVKNPLTAGATIAPSLQTLPFN